MFRLAALLLLACAALPGVAAAAGAQQLTIDLRGGAPRVLKLDRYETGGPLAVTLQAPGARSAAIDGVAPDGATVRVPLTRGSGGAFTGTLNLATAGTWTLAASTSAGGETISTESITLAAADPESNLPAALMAALSVASIAGGIGLIAVKRTADARATA